MTSKQCEQYLTKLDVCSDNNRYDVLSLWGVTNPNNSQYYPTGHYSFSPTQTQGLTTQLSPFYTTSVPFPRPSIARTFTGSSTNWYLFDFDKGIDSDAFTSLPGVSVSALLFDTVANKVYDPTLTSTAAGFTSAGNDYDFSSTSSSASASVDVSLDTVALAMTKEMGYVNIHSIGIANNIYYGVQTGVAFSNSDSTYPPQGLAIDHNGYVIVADMGNNLVRKIDPASGAVQNFHIQTPWRLAIDNKNNIYVSSLNLIASNFNSLNVINVTTGSIKPLSQNACLSLVPPNPDTSGYGTFITVDNLDNIYITYNYNGIINPSFICVMNANTGTAKILNTASADPPLMGLEGMVVNTHRDVYVTDISHQLVRFINGTSGAVKNIGTSASPSFSGLNDIALGPSGEVYVSDGVLLRKIDVSGAEVSTILTDSNYVNCLAVDSMKGSIYYTPGINANGDVYKIVNGVAFRINLFKPPRLFSYDMTNPNTSTYTLWPSDVLNIFDGGNVSVIDTVGRDCVNVLSSNSDCYIIQHAEINLEVNNIFLQLAVYSNTGSVYGDGYILGLDLNTHSIPKGIYYSPTKSGLVYDQPLLAVYSTPSNGTILYTSMGAIPFPILQNCKTIVGTCYYENIYFAKVTAPGTSVIDASKIPGSPPRYLLLLLNENSFYSMYTYDTFTDTFISSNTAAAATTHYMLAYTWGECNSNITKSLVEITFSNDYTNECDVGSGLYYQSENVYYTIPYECLGIPYEKLLTDCATIKSNMKALVDATCQAAISKVCKQQYEFNPPFSCVEQTRSNPLTIISLAASNASAFYSIFTFILAFIIKRMFAAYKASEEEKQFLSPKEEVGELVGIFLASCCLYNNNNKNSQINDSKRKESALPWVQINHDYDQKHGGDGDGDVEGHGDSNLRTQQHQSNKQNKGYEVIEQGINHHHQDLNAQRNIPNNNVMQRGAYAHDHPQSKSIGESSSQQQQHNTNTNENATAGNGDMLNSFFGLLGAVPFVAASSSYGMATELTALPQAQRLDDQREGGGAPPTHTAAAAAAAVIATIAAIATTEITPLAKLLPWRLRCGIWRNLCLIIKRRLRNLKRQ